MELHFYLIAPKKMTAVARSCS